MSAPAPTMRISWKSDQNCDLYRNFLYIHIYEYINCGFVMRDLQNEKRDHPHLPHSPPFEVEGVRIVVISFRNIAKKNFLHGTWTRWKIKIPITFQSTVKDPRMKIFEMIYDQRMWKKKVNYLLRPKEILQKVTKCGKNFY